MDLDALIERQLRRWAIGGGEGMPQPRGPCVSVARSPQAGGRELSARLSASLDYGLFGREEVDEIAASWSLRGRLAEGLDDEALRRVEERAAAAVQCSDPAARAGVQRAAEVVSLLGERGMAVLLGRGSTALVPAERALRVLVVAPFEVRVERLAASRGIEASEATELLKDAEAHRTRFWRDCFGRELYEPTDYDLVLNTEWLAPDAGAALVIDGLRRRFPGKR